MRKRIFLIMIMLLVLQGELLAADPSQELKSKGIGSEILGTLNPVCRDALNTDFQKSHGFWNAVWSKEGKMVAVDFLLGARHFSMTFLPMQDGSCQVSRAIIANRTSIECKDVVANYQKEFPKGVVKVKGEKNSFTWLSTEKGTDIYLYKVPYGCVEIFRELYLKNPPPKRK